MISIHSFRGAARVWEVKQSMKGYGMGKGCEVKHVGGGRRDENEFGGKKKS